MDFDRWLAQAWTDHAGHAACVADRIEPQGLPLAATDAQRGALARLAEHVMGAHLARWTEGRAMLARIGAEIMDRPTRSTLHLLDAGLALAGGLEGLPADLSPAQRVRVTAMAAVLLVDHDIARTGELFRRALAEIDTLTLADDDPALRTLAVVGNNLAAALEDKPQRSDAERALMILAAQAGRMHWSRAGTWLEVERAEYRLAMTWLMAGDPMQAKEHAQACLDVVQTHDAPALEHFFAWEAVGTASRAAGHSAAHAHALVQAREAYARLNDDEATACRSSLAALAA